jgi:hypothetical protein
VAKQTYLAIEDDEIDAIAIKSNNTSTLAALGCCEYGAPKSRGPRRASGR